MFRQSDKGIMRRPNAPSKAVCPVHTNFRDIALTFRPFLLPRLPPVDSRAIHVGATKHLKLCVCEVQRSAQEKRWWECVDVWLVNEAREAVAT